MDHFQESGFYSLSSDPIVAAMPPDDNHGQERLEQWVLYAVRECARRMAQPLSLVDAPRTVLIVIGPDKSRVHADVWAIADVPVAAMDWISTGQVAQLQFGGDHENGAGRVHRADDQ